MNTMEINKIAGAVLTAGVIAMLLGFVAKLIIPVHGAHGDHHGPNLFADLAPAAQEGPAKAGGLEPVSGLLANFTPEEGEKEAKKCVSCHTFDKGGRNGVGPNLVNVVGAAQAGKGGYAYSGAFQGLSGTWGYEELNKFIYKPKDYVDGTKMGAFGGIKDVNKRAAIIVFLRSMTDNPPALPEAGAAPAAPAAAEETKPAKH
jgi:cytochrome c